MREPSRSWVVCQLGAREHYAVPRALQDRDALRLLFTDAWVKPDSSLGYWRRSWRERFHPQLAAAPVAAANTALLTFEFGARLRGLQGWDRALARNAWFQRQAIAALNCQFDLSPADLKSHPTLFAYSYAALDLFRWAKARGWRTVLGQIDAGRQMGLILGRLEQQHPEFGNRSVAPPATYWDDWRSECALADVIIANSRSSLEAFRREGIDIGKAAVLPLAFDVPAAAAGFQRAYPACFSRGRPLRVLFLGQVSLLKGLVPLLEAAESLKGAPVEFHVVGPLQVELPTRFRDHPMVRWHGAVSRGSVGEHYRMADVFLFPTFSDGFGLTQLEAQAWRLPVIASQFCGDVVRDGVNGFVLPEVSGKAISALLSECLRDPQILSRFSNAAITEGEFTLERLGQRLLPML